MNKKLTFGKVLGIIFCVLAAAGTVLLLLVNGYFGGQMKLIDKFYTTIERDDFDGFKACFAEDISSEVMEEHFSEFKNVISILQDNEKIHAKVEFVQRVSLSSNLFSNNSDCYVVYDVTIYNDEEHKEFRQVFPMEREGGKWVFDFYSPYYPIFL
ncbi:MAG: nuclear transport factor 2 family protein [Oscillospiraceae bacterium]|nr:nuclear transport factor 2 family protein [Oscillospiraceae bacterium]